jgi:hypothetical protein
MSLCYRGNGPEERREWRILMRRALTLVLCLVAVVAVFFYMRETNSARIKAEALKAAERMDLSAGEGEDVRRHIEAGHETAYRNALNMANDIGGQFDAQGYFDELIGGVIDGIRNEGNDQLAEKVAEEKEHISLRVTER